MKPAETAFYIEPAFGKLGENTFYIGPVSLKFAETRYLCIGLAETTFLQWTSIHEPLLEYTFLHCAYIHEIQADTKGSLY